MFEFNIDATKNGEKETLNSKEFGNLTKIIYNILTKDLPSLKNLTDYFTNIITVLDQLNLPISWTTTAELKISYQQLRRLRLTPHY